MYLVWDNRSLEGEAVVRVARVEGKAEEADEAETGKILKSFFRRCVMPGGDGTGPGGMGPMTGRGAGYCAGYSVPGFTNRGYGFGFGRGMGFGFRGGRGGRWGAPYAGYGYGVPQPTPYAAPYGVAPTPQQEMDVLKGQAKNLEGALEEINKRLAELEAEQAKG